MWQHKIFYGKLIKKYSTKPPHLTPVVIKNNKLMKELNEKVFLLILNLK